MVTTSVDAPLHMGGHAIKDARIEGGSATGLAQVAAQVLRLDHAPGTKSNPPEGFERMHFTIADLSSDAEWVKLAAAQSASGDAAALQKVAENLRRELAACQPLLGNALQPVCRGLRASHLLVCLATLAELRLPAVGGALLDHYTRHAGEGADVAVPFS